MSSMEGLLTGFRIIFQGNAILYIFLGTLVGTFVGALPGLGPAAGMALLMGFLFGFDPTMGVLLLVGLHLGTSFGGAITAIIINTPGTSGSALTAEEGYLLSKQGRGGAALGMAAISSFVGGLLSVIALAVLAPVLTRIALGFGPVEQLSLIIMGMICVAFVSSGSLVKGLLSAVLGIFLSLVGTDTIHGRIRFTFGEPMLIEGIDFIIIIMGLFALSEVMLNIEKRLTGSISSSKVSQLFPTWKEIVNCWHVFLKSSIIGSFVGMLPAVGQSIGAFISYSFVKRTSRAEVRNEFGKGSLVGVAASEGGNSATSGGALLTTIVLGIPGSNSMAIVLGYMMVGGLRPGPLLFATTPEVAWTIVASLFIAVFFLLVINLPFSPFIGKAILSLPYNLLYPAILLMLFAGAYSMGLKVFNIYLLAFSGLLGYFMAKMKIPRPPLIVAMVLGPLFEKYLLLTLRLSHGSIMVFFQSPIAMFFAFVSLLLLLVPVFIKDQ